MNDGSEARDDPPMPEPTSSSSDDRHERRDAFIAWSNVWFPSHPKLTLPMAVGAYFLLVGSVVIMLIADPSRVYRGVPYWLMASVGLPVLHFGIGVAIYRLLIARHDSKTSA